MPFEGMRPVLHVPFADEPGQPIVEAELRGLVEAMVRADVDGLVVLGLGSEAWTLTERERERVLDLVADALGGRLPLVVGLDGTTAVAVDRAQRAVDAGAAGLMVLPPRGVSGRTAIVRHFATVADAAGVPLLIQDSPQVTGVTLDLETLVAAAEAHPALRSLKVEIPGAGAKASAAHDAGIAIVAGWGGLGYLEQVRRGAVGCMPGCDLGPALLHVDRAARAGDETEALRRYRQLLPLLAFETVSLERLLLGAKRVLVRAGLFGTSTLREPSRGLDLEERSELDAILDELAAAGVPGFAPRRVADTDARPGAPT